MIERQSEILRHALMGGTRKRVYRAYFAVTPDTADFRACYALAKRGMMKQGATRDGLTFFHVTAGGAKAVGLHLPRVLI